MCYPKKSCELYIRLLKRHATHREEWDDEPIIVAITSQVTGKSGDNKSKYNLKYTHGHKGAIGVVVPGVRHGEKMDPR